MRTRSELLGALAAPLFAGTLLGCPPTNLYRTAEPTPPGAWQLTGGVGAAQIRDLPQQTKMPTGSVELGVRHGLTDDIDVGGMCDSGSGRLLSARLRFDIPPPASVSAHGVRNVKGREVCTSGQWRRGDRRRGGRSERHRRR